MWVVDYSQPLSLVGSLVFNFRLGTLGLQFPLGPASWPLFLSFCGRVPPIVLTAISSLAGCSLVALTPARTSSRVLRRAIPVRGGGAGQHHQKGVSATLAPIGSHRATAADREPQGAVDLSGSCQPFYDHVVSLYPYRQGRIADTAECEVFNYDERTRYLRVQLYWEVSHGALSRMPGVQKAQ